MIYSPFFWQYLFSFSWLLIIPFLPAELIPDLTGVIVLAMLCGTLVHQTVAVPLSHLIARIIRPTHGGKRQPR